MFVSYVAELGALVLYHLFCIQGSLWVPPPQILGRSVRLWVLPAECRLNNSCSTGVSGELAQTLSAPFIFLRKKLCSLCLVLVGPSHKHSSGGRGQCCSLKIVSSSPCLGSYSFCGKICPSPQVLKLCVNCRELLSRGYYGGQKASEVWFDSSKFSNKLKLLLCKT